MTHGGPDSRFCPGRADGPACRRWLDGLRGLAILTVVAFHFNWLMGGFLCVDVFFVLSGFLITTLLVEEWRQWGSISLPRFYLRRGLRLLPAFWVLLLVCCGWALASPVQERPARQKEIALAACYVSNWPAFHHTDMPRLCHTWSLSVEEQFYVVWPLLLYGLLRLPLSRWWIIGFVYTGIAASAVCRAAFFAHRPPGDPAWGESVKQLYMGLDTRADALLAGCLVGLLSAWDFLPKSRAFVFGSGAAALFSAGALVYLLIFARHEHAALYCGVYTLVALLVALILVRLVVAPCRSATAVLESPVLVGAGRISYALYLFHWPIRISLKSETPAWAASAPNLIAASLTLAAAVASYFAIERPCIRLKQRLRRQRRVAPPQQSHRQPLAA
jgi:peptidoglycan/LPS O-acetylase OafA/YrhL